MMDAGTIASVMQSAQGAAGADGFLDAATNTAANTGAVPFAGMFQTMVQQTSALDKKASDAVTGLLTGVAYDFQVAAINSAGTGAYLASSTAVTPMSPVTPDSAALSSGGPITLVVGQHRAITTTLLDTSTSTPVGGATD